MLSGVNTRLVPFILKHCTLLVAVLPHIKHKRLVPYPCTDGSSTMAGGAGPDLSTCCLAPCYLSTRSLTQLLLFKIFHSYLKLCSVRKIQAMLQYLDSVPLLEHFLFSLHILGPLQSRVFLFPYIEQKGDVFHLFARAAKIWDCLLFFFSVTV